MMLTEGHPLVDGIVAKQVLALSSRTFGHALAPATVEGWTQRLLAMTTAERRALPGMEAPRADVIAAGAAIFARLAVRLEAPAIVVCDRGIRWGLAYALTT